MEVPGLGEEESGGRKGRRKSDGGLTHKGFMESERRGRRDGAMAKAIGEHGKDQGGAEGARAHTECQAEGEPQASEGEEEQGVARPARHQGVDFPTGARKGRVDAGPV